MVILGCKLLKKRRTRRKKLEIAKYSKSLLEFHLNYGLRFRFLPIALLGY